MLTRTRTLNDYSSCISLYASGQVLLKLRLTDVNGLASSVSRISDCYSIKSRILRGSIQSRLILSAVILCATRPPPQPTRTTSQPGQVPFPSQISNPQSSLSFWPPPPSTSSIHRTALSQLSQSLSVDSQLTSLLFISLSSLYQNLHQPSSIKSSGLRSNSAARVRCVSSSIGEPSTR